MASVVVKKLMLNLLTYQTHPWLCYKCSNEISICVNLLKCSVGTKSKERCKISKLGITSVCTDGALQKNQSIIWFLLVLWFFNKKWTRTRILHNIYSIFSLYWFMMFLINYYTFAGYQLARQALVNICLHHPLQDNISMLKIIVKNQDYAVLKLAYLHYYDTMSTICVFMQSNTWYSVI